MHLLRVTTMVALAAIASPAFAGDPKQEAAEHIDKAQKLFSAGKAAEALDELKTAYALDPKAELLYAIGQAHASMGQCDQAKTFYDRFLSTRPDADAADIARQAIASCKPKEVDPKAAELAAHLARATELSATKHDREAAVELEAAYTIDPRPEFLMQIGDAYGRVADCDKARGYYERYLQARPDDATTKQALARCGAQKPRRWYHDYLGVMIAGGGVVLVGGGLVEYAGARSERTKADDETVFENYVDRIDSANNKRTIAVIFGVAGTAALAGGIAHIVLRQRHSAEIAVVPTGGGAAVSLTGRF
jgi:tetratricopeptide (TPR) repeat protein